MNGGVASGAQHGGALLQLHLRQPRTRVVGVVLRGAVGEGFLPHAAQGVVDKARRLAEGVHQRGQPPSGVVAVGRLTYDLLIQIFRSEPDNEPHHSPAALS